jgi:hypothetical protein
MRLSDDVESNLKKMEVKGWKEKMRDRKQWKLVVQEGQGSVVVPTGRQEYILNLKCFMFEFLTVENTVF